MFSGTGLLRVKVFWGTSLLGVIFADIMRYAFIKADTSQYEFTVGAGDCNFVVRIYSTHRCFVFMFRGTNLM